MCMTERRSRMRFLAVVVGVLAHLVVLTTVAAGAPRLRFGVMTDTHVTADPASCERLRQALELFRREQVALVVNNGDVADVNLPAAYANYRRTFDAVFAGGERPREIFAYAAHDAFEPDFSTPGPAASYARMQKALGANAPADALQFGGYTFLVFPQYVGQPGLPTWEEYAQRVAKACADNPGRPVFVIDHVPPAGTVYHSWEWGERHTREILNRHPQVVNFSGHVHGSLRNDVFIWQGEFTAVNAGCLQLWSGVTVAETAERKPSCGVLTVDVLGDRLVIRRWDVRDGQEIDAAHRWTVPLPFDAATAPYARKVLKAKEPAPQFAADARLKAAAEGTPFAGFRLDFPEKVPGVMDFRIEAQRKTAAGDWTPVARIERIADYWKRPSDRADTCDYLFAAAYFEPAADYRIAVRPVGQYGAVGRPLYEEVSTPAASAFAPTKVAYDCAEPMRELAFNDHSGKRYVADADGYYTTGDIAEPCYTGPAAEWTWGSKERNRLILPDGIFAGPVGTRYRLTLDLRTQQAPEGSAMKMLLQKPDQLGVPGVTARLRTPNGDSGTMRYVIELTKDAQNASDTYHLTFDAGRGRIRFERIKLDALR